MTQASSPRAPARGRRSRDPDNFEHRLRFAGLDPEGMADSRRENRAQLGRMLTMFVTDWRGCPEPLCRRHRGCVTPKIRCSNLPPPTARTAMARDLPGAQAKACKAPKSLPAEGSENTR